MNKKKIKTKIKHKFKCICLTETWCRIDDTLNSNFPGYKSVHQPRKSGRGGGVSIFVHNSLTFNVVKNLCVNSPEQFS